MPGGFCRDEGYPLGIIIASGIFFEAHVLSRQPQAGLVGLLRKACHGRVSTQALWRELPEDTALTLSHILRQRIGFSESL